MMREATPSATMRSVEREGTRLTYLDFGGSGSPVVLLHGLAGYAGEWSDTASGLTGCCRVLAPDARGHGGSERAPAEVSPDARIADVVLVIEQLDMGAVVLVGQSLGGHLAILVAERHPELVSALVVVEASPVAADAAHVQALRRSLERWPVPFGSRAAAVEFFGGPSLIAEAWADGLEQRDGGWWPRFKIDVMVQMLAEATSREIWSEWERVSCPTLVVRGGAGQGSASDAQAMIDRQPNARLVTIDEAGHDLHLDCPEQWRDVLLDFVPGCRGAGRLS